MQFDVLETTSNEALVPANRGQNHLHFVQLYTSKSFESHRAELVNPPSPSSKIQESNDEDLSEHVLSPQLVNSISLTSDVVWANTKRQEGLAGRSDIHFQTAVGVPVAVDDHGNMCVVVMFSPSNIQSTDGALDFLRSISQSAVSPSVSCLLPVFDPRTTGMRLPDHKKQVQTATLGNFGEGITARFVSIADQRDEGAEPEAHSDHELATAPKDTFGIPMLPSFAEIGNFTPDENIDVFDEASYGVWTTIMDTCQNDLLNNEITQDYDINQDVTTTTVPVKTTELVKASSPPDNLSALQDQRKTRLEEFCSAFLGMSVFDLADVWVPAGEPSTESLRMSLAVTSSNSNEYLNEFVQCSGNVFIKCWAGAVGRAFSSGNPVWTGNPKVYIDSSRSTAFDAARIRTVLSVPVFSGKQPLPTCVVSFYSQVRTGSVPFVLRFVQQALRLLWDGLDAVEPHQSVKNNIWNDVGPADLGEMAADIEMQRHFIQKKRPHNLMSSEDRKGSFRDPATESLAFQLRSVTMPEPTISSGTANNQQAQSPRQHLAVPFGAVKAQIANALKAMGNNFEHVSTNREGTKRAHVMAVGPLPGPNRLPTRVVTSRRYTPATPPVSRYQTPSPNHVPSAESVNPPPLLSDISLSKVPMELPPDMPLAAVVVPSTVDAGEQQFCMPISEPDQAEPIGAVKRCRIQGCNEAAVSRRPHCVKHSGNRLCEHEGCTKCAQGSTRFCIAHGGGRRCTFPGCDKGARDKFFCAAHGGGKRCSQDGCTKSAVGGSKLCTAHGGGRRCAVEGCDKSAQSSTKFCVKHGGGKKCAHSGCKKVARGRTQFCAAHGGGVRCKLEGCNRVAIGKKQLCRAHGGGSRAKKMSAAPVQQFQQTQMLQALQSQEPLMSSGRPGVQQFDFMSV